MLRRKPRPVFYLFSIRASELRALAGIQRRSARAGKSRVDDHGIQRRHDEARSQEIGRFVEFGFPWSDLSEAARRSGDFFDLRKPGWLPTAVVVNIGNDHKARKWGQIW